MLFNALNDFQSELYQLLRDSDEVSALLGEAIYDGAPLYWPDQDIYAQIGDGQMRDIGAQFVKAREWQFSVLIFARTPAFGQVMRLSNAVQDAVLEHKFASEYWLQSQFVRMIINRLDQDQMKRVTLQFKAKFQQVEEV